jgi:Ca2+-binding EF-hand superfamily protein
MGQAASAREHRMYRMKARKKAYEVQQDMKTKLAKYDVSKTGTLTREEVRKMASDLLNQYTPVVGGLTDDDVDMMMRCGGDNVKPELTLDEMPGAMAVMTNIKESNKYVHELFKEFDVDRSGQLPADQLMALLTKVNGGAKPADNDVSFIIKQCEPRGAADPIGIAQLKAALGCWYCLQEKSMSDKVKESFDQADTKGNGVIEKNELRALLKQLNPGFSDTDLDQLVDTTFGEFDTNKSGVLEFDQFVDWLCGGQG